LGPTKRGHAPLRVSLSSTSLSSDLDAGLARNRCQALCIEHEEASTLRGDNLETMPRC
jgi:hypothetical protein